MMQESGILLPSSWKSLHWSSISSIGTLAILLQMNNRVTTRLLHDHVGCCCSPYLLQFRSNSRWVECPWNLISQYFTKLQHKDLKRIFSWDYLHTLTGSPYPFLWPTGYSTTKERDFHRRNRIEQSSSFLAFFHDASLHPLLWGESGLSQGQTRIERPIKCWTTAPYYSLEQKHIGYQVNPWYLSQPDVRLLTLITWGLQPSSRFED